MGEDQIRPARAQDIEEIAEVITTVLTFDGIPEVQTVEELAEEFSGPCCLLGNDVMVAQRDSRLAGVAYTYFLPSETKQERCYIVGGVLPEYRRTGIGTSLMKWATNHAETLLTSTGRLLPKYVRAQASQLNTSAPTLFSAFNMSKVRVDEDVIRQLRDIPPAEALSKYRIVQWDSSRDDQARDVKNRAFVDHWGSTPSTPQLWSQIVNGPNSRLEHSFFAVDEQQEIVGLVVAHRFESDDQLLGKKIGWINTQNPTGAYGLYASLGFEFFRGRATFERQVS